MRSVSTSCRFRQPSDPFSEFFAGFAGMPASSPDVIQCGEFKGSAKPDAGKVCYRPADKSAGEDITL